MRVSNWDWKSFELIWRAPDVSAVMNGRLISVCDVDDSFLSRLLNTLNCHMIDAKVQTARLLEFAWEMVSENNVEIFASQMRAAVS